MREYLERALRTAAAVVAAMVCTVSPAQAAFYSGAWDPTYGMPFSGLGWRGTVNVFVPDDCASGVGPQDYFFGSDCANGSSVQSASVEFYDVADVGKQTIGTVTFATSSMSVLALHFDGDDLISLLTLPSSWNQAVWDPLPGLTPAYFSLLFVDSSTSDFLQFIPDFLLGFLSPGLIDKVPPGYFGPLLLSSSVDFDNRLTVLEFLAGVRSLSISDVETYPPEFPNDGRLFGLAAPPTDIPEPGSLALVALALFATAWVARNRRRV